MHIPVLAIQSGSRVGAYDVVSLVGAGGMGEVWRARDSRIGRDIALKVLPASFSADAEHLRRFEQEAKTAGSLSHPNLVTLYELGVSDGAPFIAMELLDGETLRDRLGDGATAHALPYRKALEYAAQLATGLAAAHDHGIIHRDLKPENVFVTRDGRLKILDFGLAKLRIRATEIVPDDKTQQRGTNPGTIMGTAGYMSPEQVRGVEVDHRSDIFSFGAILYEMLTGRRAFRRNSSVETMNAVLNEDPPELSSSTAQHVAPAVDRIIRRCLEKSPEERFQSARDLAFALEALSSTGISHEHVAASPPTPRRVKYAAAALLIALAAATAGAWFGRRFSAAPAGTTRLAFSQLTFDTGIETTPSISPDGKTFAFVKGVAPRRQIFVQRVDGRSAIALSKSPVDDDHGPVLSPDGSQIVFRSERDGGGLFVMGATGESVRRLTSTGFDPAWSPDGTVIVFTSEGVGSPTSRNSVSSLSTVDVATGTVRKLFAGDAMQPSISPNGKRISYWALPPAGGQRDIYTIAMNGDPKTVVRATNDAPLDWNPLWAPDGRSIIFVSDRGGTMNLWRLDLDEESGQPRGDPRPMSAPAHWVGNISLSGDGKHLLYDAQTVTQELWRGTIDAQSGKLVVDPLPALSGSMLVRGAEVSPDGQWIAFSTEGRQEDVYVMRFDGTDLRRLTNDAARDRGVSWSYDSSRICFYSTRAGGYDVWSVRSDGSDLVQHTQGTQVNYPRLSPDGRRVAFFDLTRAHVATIGASPAVATEPLPPITGSAELFWPSGWSPDGTMLIGSAWRTRQPRFYTYSLPDHTYRLVADDLGYSESDAVGSWLDDHRVLLSGGDHLFIIDVNTRARRDLGEFRDASTSRNGRHVTTMRTRVESDVWQLTFDDPAAPARQ